MFKVKRSGFIEMKGNIWDEEAVIRITEKIADKFLREFRLYSHHDSMSLINKGKLPNKDVYYLFNERVRPEGWLRNAEIFYILRLKEMKPKALVNNEGQFLNVTSGYLDPQIKYDKRSKVLKIENEPVLILELTKRTLDNLELFDEVKKEIVKKLKDFSESVRKDEDFKEKIFFLKSCKDCWKLDEIQSTISLGFFYPDTICFRKEFFSKGTGIILVYIEHYRSF